MKLFWNTHNQNKSFWGEYHLLNSKEWIFDILGEIKFEEVEDLNLAQNTDSLMIIDSEISGKKDFYEILLNKYKRIYLIHLGDEGGRINKKIYSNFQHVFRTFYLKKDLFTLYFLKSVDGNDLRTKTCSNSLEDHMRSRFFSKQNGFDRFVFIFLGFLAYVGARLGPDSPGPLAISFVKIRHFSIILCFT